MERDDIICTLDSSVQVIESFSTLHLVMECASEGDVQARICKEGPFSEDQARHIFAQVASAINHMVSSLWLSSRVSK